MQTLLVKQPRTTIDDDTVSALVCTTSRSSKRLIRLRSVLFVMFYTIDGL